MEQPSATTDTMASPSPCVSCSVRDHTAAHSTIDTSPESDTSGEWQEESPYGSSFTAPKDNVLTKAWWEFWRTQFGRATRRRDILQVSQQKLRKNQTRILSLPKWQVGGTLIPKDSGSVPIFRWRNCKIQQGATAWDVWRRCHISGNGFIQQVRNIFSVGRLRTTV